MRLIDHSVIWKILRETEEPAKIVVKGAYKNILFISVLKKYKNLNTQLQINIGYSHLSVKIHGSIYTDDIVLIANIRRKMHTMINKWSEEREKMKR